MINRKIKILITLFVMFFTLQIIAQPVGIIGKSGKGFKVDLSKSGPVLFNQMTNPGGAFMSSFHYTNEEMADWTCAAADDFEVPEGETWEVHSFGVVGSYFANMPGGGDTLNVFILADNDGLPGDTLYEYWAYTNFEKTEEMYQSENGNTYVHTYFEIYLPSNITFTEGIYWLSVQMYANSNVTGKWGWRENEYTSAINGAEWCWINPLDGTGYGYTEWTPASIVVGPWLTWELAFAVFGEPKANDLSVKSILSPDSYYYGVPSSPKPVTVEIKNEGTNIQSAFDVKYNFNGEEVVENVGDDVSLDYNETYTFTFSQKVDLSTPGNYPLTVSTMLPDDGYPDNDSKSMNIYVFDPTIYEMPSGEVTSITTCSGTFTDAGGLEGGLTVSDWGILTIYPVNEGDKTTLDFIEFDIGWSDFWIFDGENVDAPMLGFWEDTLSPGKITASYQNTTGALTVKFNAQTWQPLDKPGWSANITCHTPVANDFGVLKVEVGTPIVHEKDYVSVFAYVKNNGTDIRTKDVTFKVNGQVFAVINTDSVVQSDTVIVEAIWHPDTTGSYVIEASIPEDSDNSNNLSSVSQYVYPFDYFIEGFESPVFPPDEWSQSSIYWVRTEAWPGVGDANAFCNVPYGMVDTLYTPLLQISDTAVLHFMAFSSGWWPGELDVVWIDGETGESHLIEHVSLPFLWYSNFNIDVSEAKGANYIGFVGKYNPDGGNGEVKIDEVVGEGITRFFFENDLKAYILDGDNTPEAGHQVTFYVDIKNLGSQFQSGTNYTVKLMAEPDVELTSVSGQDIDAKQTINFSIDYTFQNAGQYNCYVVIDYLDDQNQDNNKSTTLPIYVQQQGIEQIKIGNGNDYSTNWYHPITTGKAEYFTQTIFYADEIGEPKSITGIMYYYRNAENYIINNVPVRLWFSETTETDMAGDLVAVNDDFCEVFDGTVTYYPGIHGVYIPLDNVYDYQGGNLMITTFKENNTDYLGSSYIGTTLSDEVRVRYYSGYNFTIDPYDQSTLDVIPFEQQHRKAEFGNIKLYKYNLNGQYCIPPVVNGTESGDYINDVTFNEINNLNTGSQGGPAYNDYLGISANVERCRSYEITISAKCHTTDGLIEAWIDFNGNKSFYDEGEQILAIKTDSYDQYVKVLVTIPEDAALGISALRIRNSASSDLFEACESVDYGETEDYSINIIETQQVYNPVVDFSAALENGNNAVLNWKVPDNPAYAKTEGFEMISWPPEGWEIKHSTTIDGELTDPASETWYKNSNQSYVYNGKYSAMVSASAPDFNWLISPEVLIYGNDELSFMLDYTNDNNVTSKFYVRVFDGNLWTTVLEYVSQNDPSNNFDQPVTVDLSQFAGKNVKVAFVTESNNANPVAVDDIIINGTDSNDKGVVRLSGYEIYRNGEFLENISEPFITEYDEVLSETENYTYCIKAVYSNSEKSDEKCDNLFFLEPLTPPVNTVATAENNNVLVNWLAPDGGLTRFEDDFENYTAGEQLACQNPDDWTTWLLEPCSNADPFVVDDVSYDGVNSVKIADDADLLYMMDKILTSGKYSYNFRMYVEDGFNGYFNVLQEHNLTQGSKWGMQVFFDEGGIGIVDADGSGAATFNYEYNKWMYMNVVIDLDDDTAFYYIDDNLIHSWKWSVGINGNQTSKTFHGGDFYAWNANNYAKYYIDNFKIVELFEPEVSLSYNIYRDGNLLTNVSQTNYTDESVVPGYHSYCVSAVYDEGESDYDCDYVDMYSAPENFNAVIINENDVYCSWDFVQGDNVEGYYVYRDDVKVSGLISENEWTDFNVEGGAHKYAVTASYNGEESEPCEPVTVLILIKPKNLVAQEDYNGNIVLNWDGVGEVHSGEMVELYQHDGMPNNGLYEWFEIGYGAVFDLSAYPDATIELADFYHESWGLSGIWSYKFHIVDWENLTELAVVGPFQTTGDDKWEVEIPLGSVSPTSNLIGIFLEPMSNDPQDAYPVIAFDAEMNGYSIQVSLNDFTQFDPVPGDFLLDLWIWSPFDKKVVKPAKFKVNNEGLKNTRKPYKPFDGFITLNQNDKGSKVLTGYNVYYAFDSDNFEIIGNTPDTTYVHYGAAVNGAHYYYVTSLYEEGESQPSDTAVVLVTNINQNELSSFAVYPNPVKDYVNIKSENEIESLLIVNTGGQTMFKVASAKTTQLNIDLSNFPSGVYLLRIKTNQGWKSRKIIKM
jgi:hypothetical protein